MSPIRSWPTARCVTSGQPVVAVMARSRELAEDAAEGVNIEYEPLPVVVSARESDLVLMRWARRTGDVDERLRPGAPRGDRDATPCPGWPPCRWRLAGCLAEYDQAGDKLTVWASVQDTHRPLAQLAHILDRPQDRIRVIAPDVGGAFGSKGVIAPEVATAAAAAIALGVPVKWTEDRFENLVACYQGRGIEGDLELALDGDGRILGLRARLWADLGGYLLTTTPIPPAHSGHAHHGLLRDPGCGRGHDRDAHAQGTHRPLPGSRADLTRRT